MVEVTGEHGHVASCSSNDTSCAVKLDCGHSYSATLVASTENCNSTRHTDIYFDSGETLSSGGSRTFSYSRSGRNKCELRVC